MHLIEIIYLVISCSNDTTIKLWSLGGLSLLDDVKAVSSKATLNEDRDYVRAIAYSEYSSLLYSAADNGVVRQWDLTALTNNANKVRKISFRNS